MPKIPSKSEKQEDAEANVEGFKSELGPFVVAAETTRMAMVFADAKQARVRLLKDGGGGEIIPRITPVTSADDEWNAARHERVGHYDRLVEMLTGLLPRRSSDNEIGKA